MAQSVERVLGKDEVPGSNPGSSSKKSIAIAMDFFICVRRTQHRLTKGQHHYERSESIVLQSSGHKTMSHFVQMKLCFAQMM